jgi:glutamate formiminotransferase/formiminotetrahydrofolate cyclodeaminase
MTKRIIECVPNFSEGRDKKKIKQITDAISFVDKVKLLHVDSGYATNRTVVTFAGDPDSVIEAAFRGIKMAGEILDMRIHRGEHPRLGATDVCPLVPIRGINMSDTVDYAHQLGSRVGEELGIPGYYYEHAATSPQKQNLANIRKGEYEGLEHKLSDPYWKPDFGPTTFNARSGATAIGARDFLVAFNINLNTSSAKLANIIASEIREKGRIKREGDPVTGEICRNNKGEPVFVPGSLKSVKGIGWYIEEYGIAQVSLNLTNINITPIHTAYEEVCKKGETLGVRVTGSELIGMVPLYDMLEAGRYFLGKQKDTTANSDSELVNIAIKFLGLQDLRPFDPEERIIEYNL